MSELPHFIEILRGQNGDALVMLITFALTVLIDLATAVRVGVVLSAIVFLKQMTDRTTVQICENLMHENNDETAEVQDADLLFQANLPPDAVIFEINGPFFYSVADLLDEALLRLHPQPSQFILRLSHTSMIDATGLQAMKKFGLKCAKNGILFMITDVNQTQRALLKSSGVEEAIGTDHIFPDVHSALQSIGR